MSWLQAEQIRCGLADASVLSALVTQQLLSKCTVEQLSSDVTYLQEAVQAEQQARNHVGLAVFQQLLTICQVFTLC